MTEDISEFVQAEQTSYTFYNEDGEVVTEDVGTACAYIANVKNKEFYYIKTFSAHKRSNYCIKSLFL